MTQNDFSHISALVVDDDPFMRDLIGLTLQRLQLGAVATAGSGEEAIALLQHPDQAYDLLLCDLQMPGMDGIELLRHLAELNLNLGVILFSGAEERILRAAVSLARARFLNVLGSVQKPVTAEALTHFIRDYDALRAQQQPWQSQRVLTEAELQQCLTEDYLELFYQPQIDVRTGAVVGVEALARLRHPLYGLLSPYAFIPVAEQTALIHPFTKAVMALALDQAQRWRREGLDFRVGVNISSAALAQLDLPQTLLEQCEHLGIDTCGITMEITETHLDQDSTTSLEVLTRIRLRGLGLSIDDFGTGYSSLDRLKRVPFDELKIDGSFVHGASHDPAAKAIFESSVALGKQLALRVLVEGVEDREDWELAVQLGCDVAQGYFIARPMAAADLNDWLRAWRGLDSLPRLGSREDTTSAS